MSLGAARRPLWAPFVLLVLAVVVIDQLTKAWIVTQLADGRVVHLVGDWVRLVYSRNDGALFGLFRGQVLVFGLLSLVVIGFLVRLHARSGRSPYMTVTIGLLLGGAIGNALDRFRLGHVVDFVDGGVGGLRFYTFNVADACISTAIVLLLALVVWPSLAGPQANGQGGVDG